MPESAHRTEADSYVALELARIRNKLLDLSLRNKLLNYRERASAIRVVDELPDEVFGRLVGKGLAMAFAPRRSDDAPADYEMPLPEDGKVKGKHKDRFLQTDQEEARLESRLRSVSADAARVIEESGVNQLHLALGHLQWIERDSGKACRAPLILVPATLKRDNQASAKRPLQRYRLNYSGEDIGCNLSLQQLLHREYGIELPSLPDDDAQPSPEDYFAVVAAAVSHLDGWQVLREVVLDFFTFANLGLYLDLDSELWPDGEAPADHGRVGELLGRDTEVDEPSGEIYDIDRDPRAADLELPYDADSSQHSAILDALEGSSLVIQGPPGTGKSQTITNLIAASLVRGKTVLFLAEKLAALQVVHRRLAAVDLDDFVVELHSAKAHKRTLLDGLERRLQRKRRSRRGVRATVTERTEVAKQLRAHADALDAPVGSSGLSLHEVLWRLEGLRSAGSFGEVVELPGAPEWTPGDYRTRRDVAAELAERVGDTVPRQNSFYGLEPTALAPANERRLAPALQRAAGTVDGLRARLAELEALIGGAIPHTFDAVREIVELDRRELQRTPDPVCQDLVTRLLDTEARTTARELCTRVEAIANLRAEAQRTTRGLAELDAESFRALEDAVVAAACHGVDDLSFRDVADVDRVAAELRDEIDRLADELARHRELGYPSPRTFADVRRLLDSTAHLIDTAPVETELFLGEGIFDRGMLELFRSARAEADLLHERRDALNRDCALEHATDRALVHDCIATLRAREGSWFAWTSGAFRRARRLARTLLRVEPKTLGEVCDRLEQLDAWLADVDEFRDRREYTDRLGLLFAGVDTRWEVCERILIWATELPERVVAEEVLDALQIDFRGAMRRARAVRRACQRALDALEAAVEQFRECPSTAPVLRLDAGEDADPSALATRLDVALSITRPLMRYGGDRIDDRDAPLPEFDAAVRAEGEARRSIGDLEVAAERYRAAVGTEFRGADTDAHSLRAHLVWVEQLDAALQRDEFEWLCATETDVRALRLAERHDAIRQKFEDLEAACAELSEFGSVDADRLLATPGGSTELQAVGDKLSKCQRDLGSIRDWSDQRRTCARARELGLGPLVDGVDDGSIAAHDCGHALEVAYHVALVDAAVTAEPMLAAFTRSRYDAAASQYCDLDRSALEHASTAVANALLKRKIAKGVSTGPVRRRTELGLIRREISKVKRHVPIRSLVDRAGKALFQLKPCAMMSPLSVSQFLPRRAGVFDLLVVDEASQLRPEECLGAIARCRQVVVVGDSNQLPPTNFFQRVTEGEGDETAFDEIESLLDVCTQSYGHGRRLRWHYRSCHEDLIRFSHEQFYDRSLVVFPAARRDAPDLGVEVRLVEGRYAEGRNPTEADYLAEAVLRYADAHPDRSIGVVAFGVAQRDLILERIERVAAGSRDNLALYQRLLEADEPLFVKNLENVQGDERDAIFLSFTYGPDESGKVYQRFGPINTELGWRRLNVMFTRARLQVIAVSSLRPEDIRVHKSSPRGVKVFKRYLEYGLTANSESRRRSGAAAADSSFRDEVGALIRSWGYEVEAAVGVGEYYLELAVRHPERRDEFAIGIECDGEVYGASRSTRDRDRLRHEVLSRLGWTLYRVVSIDWYRHRDRELAQLRDAIRSACGSG